MRPKDGIARAAPEMPTASSRPRPVCPMSHPAGIAMSEAISIAANV